MPLNSRDYIIFIDHSEVFMFGSLAVSISLPACHRKPLVVGPSVSVSINAFKMC